MLSACLITLSLASIRRRHRKRPSRSDDRCARPLCRPAPRLCRGSPARPAVLPPARPWPADSAQRFAPIRLLKPQPSGTGNAGGALGKGAVTASAGTISGISRASISAGRNSPPQHRTIRSRTSTRAPKRSIIAQTALSPWVEAGFSPAISISCPTVPATIKKRRVGPIAFYCKVHRLVLLIAPHQVAKIRRPYLHAKSRHHLQSNINIRL